jgi:hypothetical protein
VNRYIKDAEHTLEGIKADLISRIQAGSPVSDDDWDAYERAQDLVKQQQVLWQDGEGLLTDHDHCWIGTGNA